MRQKRSYSGSVILTLFAMVGVVGILAAAAMSVFQGPVKSMSDVTQQTIVKNDLLALSALISEESLRRADADCDADGMIEPIEWKSPGTLPAPTGGGIIPDTIGGAKTDPWKMPYGYCVWDLGEKTLTDNIAGCGGSAANRLKGLNDSTGIVIAIISAGPDRIFQTSCHSREDLSSEQVVKPDDSDDIIRVYPYGQFLLPRVSQAQLVDLPDAACAPETPGIMRLSLGVVQVCTDTGWTEVGTSASADANFIPVTNAEPNSVHTSNEIIFTGFLTKKTLIVTGAATLRINGTIKTSPAEISASDSISLTAAAGPIPDNTQTYSISVGGVRKSWTITTRDSYPPVLTISPSAASMDIAGPAMPSYSDPVGFLVQNTGEKTTEALNSATLSNTSNFEFYTDPGHSGDDCKSKRLAGGDSCVIDVRAKASANGNFSGTLSVSVASLTANASLTAAATGWTCSLPWGGTLASGNDIDAYASNNVACGTACSKEVRTCTGKTLSGSYSYEACNPDLNCGYTWIAGAWGSCSASCNGGTQSRSVTCRRSDNTTVANSLCPAGTKPATSRACNTGACTWLAGAWGSCTVSCGGGTQSRSVTCRDPNNVSVSTSLCPAGTKPATSTSCNTSACCASNTGQACTLNWCANNQGFTCAHRHSDPGSCQKHMGGRITSCSDNGTICCSLPGGGTIKCNGTCS